MKSYLFIVFWFSDFFYFPFLEVFWLRPKRLFSCAFQTGDTRTTDKEPAMKFYEIPLSPITESCRQILFQVAIAVLGQCSSTVPLHTKTDLRRMSGLWRDYTLKTGIYRQGSRWRKLGRVCYKSNRGACAKKRATTRFWGGWLPMFRTIIRSDNQLLLRCRVSFPVQAYKQTP